MTRSSRPRGTFIVTAAAAALASIPVAAALLQAQELKCYAEYCIETDKGTESCYEKPIPCPPEIT